MNELLIDLDTNAKTALYGQIYEYIRRDIVDGKLSCGERLPSTRLLAANLSVSRSTVELAYEQLVSEGYLKARRGSGYYVCELDSLYDISGVLGGDMIQPVRTPDAVPKTDRTERVNFLPGQVDVQSFPYNAWRRASKEALQEMACDLPVAGVAQGEYALRETLARYLYQARGVRCAPEQLVIGAGNEYLLLLLGQILGGGRSVAMESPTYLQAYHTFQNIGYKVDAVPMDKDGMVVGRIPKKNTLAYVMPSHQFPLGTVMPLQRRLKLLAWAEEKPGRYIIEDDHDSEFRYKGRPIPSLHGMAKHARVIYLGTFSNSIMPSIRISYMVLPPELLYAYHQTCGFYASTVSRIQQMSVCRFMETGYFERHLNKMRGVYRSKHDFLLGLLKGKKWVHRVYGDHAGLHLVVELSAGIGEKELLARANARGLRLQGMSDCYIAGQKKPDANPIVLLGFGNLSEKKMREGIALLEACVLEMGDQRS